MLYFAPMQNERLDIGIIGYGFAGQLHEEVLRGDNRVNKIAIVDIDWDKRAKAQQEGLETFSDVNQLLDTGPDILITALPPAKNLETIKIIVNHDPRPRAVLIEKPLATTVQDAQNIERELSRSGILSMVGLTGHGFHPEFKRAYELIKEGRLGMIHSVLENIHLGGAGLPEHYLTRLYGGVVIENGIHTLDHLCYLTQRTDWQVTSARIGNDHWGKECPDWGEATLSTAEQIAHASWLWPREFSTELHDYSVTVIGTKGRMTIFGFDQIRLQTEEGAYEEKFHKETDDLTTRHLPGFILEIDAFLEAVMTNGRSPVDVSYAIYLQRLLHEIEQSASQGP